MSRGLDAANVTASTAAHVRPVVFVKLEFDSGTDYLHDGLGTITWDSQNWQGVGDFGGVEAIEEHEGLSPTGVRLLLSGLDSTLLDEALNNDWVLRDVSLYIGFLDADNTLTADPDLVWRGTMDNMSVEIGAVNAISVTCESRLILIDSANGSMFDDTEQQADYSGDLFFQYMAQMEDAQIRFGGRQQAFTVGAGPGGEYGTPSSPGELRQRH